MPATARLIVMLEEEQKAALEAEARAAAVSTAELVRRRLFAPLQPEEDAFLRALADVGPVVRKACDILVADLAEIRLMREGAASAETLAAERARGALTREELEAVADRLRLDPARGADPTPRKAER